MANQITDNRTLITAHDATTNVVDETGSAYSGLNTEFFIEGSSSCSNKYSMGSGGIFYNYTTGTDVTDTHFYTWWACGTPGKLQTQASGGVRLRFCGATITDWFEIYIAGSDTYTGGFIMDVTDIVTARANAVGGTLGGTNGTTPAVSAIQYVGIFFDVPGSVSGNVDNCFVDSMWSLPASTPGIIVEGRNGGSTDWTFQDIIDAGDNGDTTKAWGTGFVETNGSFAFNTPIQIGIDDTTTHAFSDSNAIIGWQNQLVDLTSFYNITLIGNSGGTTDFELGIVSGSGDDRVGSQGGIIFAAASGARWNIVADDADVDSCNLYGVQMIHGEDFQLDTSSCLAVNSTFLDCTSATISNGKILKCSIIDANTADGVAFMTTDDITDIVRSSFVFSDGHAIELTTPIVSSQTSKGNIFNSYGATTSNDAAVYNNSAGEVTITVTDSGDSPTYRDGTSASTIIVAGAVTVEVSTVETDGTPIVSASVLLAASDGTGPFPFEDSVTITRVTTTATVAHTGHGLASNDKVLITGVELTEPEYIGVKQITLIDANSYSYTVSGSPNTPATGAITSTFVALEGTTDGVTGILSTTRVYSTDQPVVGWTRKSSSAPYYKEGVLTGSVSSTEGFIVPAVMALDQ